MIKSMCPNMTMSHLRHNTVTGSSAWRDVS